MTSSDRTSRYPVFLRDAATAKIVGTNRNAKYIGVQHDNSWQTVALGRP
jgi:hypothetical protein